MSKIVICQRVLVRVTTSLSMGETLWPTYWFWYKAIQRGKKEKVQGC